MNILYSLNLKKGASRDHFSSEKFGLVGMRLKDLSLSSAYEALSIATGITIYKDGSGNLSARQSSTCTSESVESYEAFLPYQHENDCPRKKQFPKDGNVQCGALEFYKIENIVLKGYLKIAGKNYAFAETPDGITWLIKSGDYIGQDFGLVTSIGDDGLIFKEILKNLYGYYYEQEIFADYQNNRRPILKK